MEVTKRHEFLLSGVESVLMLFLDMLESLATVSHVFKETMNS